MKVLRLVLGDQLSHSLASLQMVNQSSDVILMCEVIEEATYVKHHQQKLIFIFSAMRHFADLLRQKKMNVDYVKIDDPENKGSLDAEIARAIKQHRPDRVELTFPSEYRLLEKFERWQRELTVDVIIHDDDRFFCTPEQFKQWSKGYKQLRMENFYRTMRIQHHILLDKKNKPVGGQWNFDKENRKSFTKLNPLPERRQNKHDRITREVTVTVKKYFSDHVGSTSSFRWAVTREDALEELDFFIRELLPNFGDYQDMMNASDAFLFHSLLSPYLNTGLLLPREVCLRAEKAFHEGQAPINAVEGFIRQILGWREYVRGVYWLKMPGYDQLNYFAANRPLPSFYWDANTKMNCVRTAVKQTLDNAYSHHIQRLMVTGNFALLAGLDPRVVCEWYLLVYIDAFDWVELPNTLGMALFADGGLMASKPYAASGKYIQRMSNFCQGCDYKPQEVLGERACPFNSLYWDFLRRHEDKLRTNQRLVYTYATWDKMSADKQMQIVNQAAQFLDRLDQDEIDV